MINPWGLMVNNREFMGAHGGFMVDSLGIHGTPWGSHMEIHVKFLIDSFGKMHVQSRGNCNGNFKRQHTYAQTKGKGNTCKSKMEMPMPMVYYGLFVAPKVSI